MQSWWSKLGWFCQKKVSLLVSMTRNLRKSGTAPFSEIQKILSRLKNVDVNRVLVMAQSRTKKELREKELWIVDLCKAHGLRYTPRLHIELYGNRRGT